MAFAIIQTQIPGVTAVDYPAIKIIKNKEAHLSPPAPVILINYYYYKYDYDFLALSVLLFSLTSAVPLIFQL